jgi:PST family polysaccharide transporter
MSMKKKLASSSLWSVSAALFNNLSTMIVFIALARLLNPTEFGIVAFATVFIDISRIVVLGGIPDALIQRDEWDDDVATTAFWTNLGLGVLLSAILAAIAAPLVGNGYGRTFALVLASLSLVLVIEGASAVHVAKLRREFRHKMIAKRSMTTNIVSGLLGVAFAYMGWGVWALVVSRLIGVTGSSVILWRATDFRPRLAYSFDHLRGFAKFSSHILGSQLMIQAGAQVPAMLIGGLLGPAAIAQYRVGWRSLNLIISVVILPIQTAAVSAFSRLSKDRDALGAGYLRVTRTCALVSCPAFFGLAAVAPDFVPVLFGPQWTQASWVLVALSLIVGPTTLGYFEGASIAASGRSDLTFYASLFASIGNIAAAAAAVTFGPIAVAAALTLRAHLTTPFSLRLVQRAIGVRPMQAILGILPPYLAAMGMAAGVTAVRWFVMPDATALLRLAVCLPLGGVLYLALLPLFGRQFVRTAREELAPLAPGPLRKFLQPRSRG